MTRVLKFFALASVCLLTACSSVTTQTPPTAPTKPPQNTEQQLKFTEANFSDLPAIDASTWAPALAAFNQSCTALNTDPKWAPICKKATATSSEDAQRFFKKNFKLWRVSIANIDKKSHDEVSTTESGLMTGYYEPLLIGSRHPSSTFKWPIYRVPDDLIVVDLAKLYPQLKGLRLRGKVQGRRLVPYDTRGQIQNKKDWSHYAIAWVNDPIESLFLHIQGSGRILLPDGTYMRVGYADQNGYEYKSIAHWISKTSGIPTQQLSMQRIKAWAQAHPQLVKKAMAQNPSFIFFEERKGDPELGPIGAQGVPLTPGASVAVDTKTWRLGVPFIVQAYQAKPSLNFTRPVIAQDTGGAIKGLIRFDFFWGYGDEAGEYAGRQRSNTQAWILTPTGISPDDVVKTKRILVE